MTGGRLRQTCSMRCSKTNWAPLRGAARVSRLEDAARLFREMTLADTCAEFLTLPAYGLID